MIYDSAKDILQLGVSFADKYLQFTGELLRAPKDQKKRLSIESQSDGDGSETVIPEASTRGDTFLRFVKYVDDRFLRAIPFIRSGLKGSARAAEFPSLAILASRLESGIR